MVIQVLFILLTFFLTGCVSVRPPAQAGTVTRQPFAVRVNRLEKLNRWQINGAAAVTHRHNAQSANYRWRQTEQTYQIQLAGALNLGATTISGGVSGVTVTQANGQRWRGRDVNALITEQLGWQLPVEQLVYWVRGIPAPTVYRQLTTDAQGHLQSLQQLGWSINWSRYTSVGSYDLPRWIVLQRPNWKIKLLIRQWQLP